MPVSLPPRRASGIFAPRTPASDRKWSGTWGCLPRVRPGQPAAVPPAVPPAVRRSARRAAAKNEFENMWYLTEEERKAIVHIQAA
eukprot:632056-Hanusia_phi.AAC.1